MHGRICLLSAGKLHHFLQITYVRSRCQSYLQTSYANHSYDILPVTSFTTKAHCSAIVVRCSLKTGKPGRQPRHRDRTPRRLTTIQRWLKVGSSCRVNTSNSQRNTYLKNHSNIVRMQGSCPPLELTCSRIKLNDNIIY